MDAVQCERSQARHHTIPIPGPLPIQHIAVFWYESAYLELNGHVVELGKIGIVRVEYLELYSPDGATSQAVDVVHLGS